MSSLDRGSWLFALLFSAGTLVASWLSPVAAQIPDNFRRENLVAWCIVPFDAKQRNAQQRVAMLRQLGLTRCAYDWRTHHVPTFEQEIREYRERGIEYFAFWDEHQAAFELFQQYDLKPQIWKTLTQVQAPTWEEYVERLVENVLPLAKRTAELGCKLGLYNHGGKAGEPKTLAAVCQALRQQGHGHVGIVYNFHHAHGDIKNFDTSLRKMLPYLFCVNLNGMVDLTDSKYKSRAAQFKILPIGAGEHERTMIRSLIENDYRGPIGVLGHVAERDVSDVLRENMEGLEWILTGAEKPGWLQAREDAPKADKPLVQISESNRGLDARLGFINVDADDRLSRPPFRVSCRARLFSADSFNILVAKNPKTSSDHWELYTYQRTGELSFFIPGYRPAEIKSGINVADGQWRDLAVDFDGTQVLLWADGKVVHRQRVTKHQAARPVGGPLTIGSLASQQFGCDGQIDEVRIASQPGLDDASRLLGAWTFDRATKPDQIVDESPAGQRTDFVQTGLGDDYLSRWTPRSRQNSRFTYENEKDPDWVDDRFSKMETGPTFNQSIKIAGRGVIPKAIAVQGLHENRAHFIFNSETLNVEAAWTGEFIGLPPARFGILQTPSVAGTLQFLGARQGAWTSTARQPDGELGGTQSVARFVSTAMVNDGPVFSYRVGASELMEFTAVEKLPEFCLVHRRWTAESVREPVQVPLFDLGPAKRTDYSSTEQGGSDIFVWHPERQDWAYVLRTSASFEEGDRLQLIIDKNAGHQQPVAAWYGKVPLAEVPRAVAHLKSLPPAVIRPAELPLAENFQLRWGQPIETTGVLSTQDAPFVVDTITVPYQNRFNALMFTSGFDFLPDGRALVCTVHGDVWLVAGIDEDLDRITWQRFATGLYHPLGLKIIDGRPVVLCRDRLTVLEDLNSDGEADLYHNFNDDLVITGQNHGYAMSLETDPAGNFYFIKSGTAPPHGGTMLKVAPDGSKLEVFATGYRHANGLGVSPTGLVTSADNEGNWIPSTRIDAVRQGGFYGHLPTHRRETPPENYDLPLLWLPRSMDNSAGGQVWVESQEWGPLQGSMIHLSFGRCTANVVLPQKLEDGTHQAAAYRLELPQFLSGSMRGRFNPRDGDLYVCGLDGWQTAAIRDGCFQRVRATGIPFCLPVAFEVSERGVEIGFSQPLSPASVSNLENWQVEVWNYRWSADYGSDHFSVANPAQVGHDRLEVSGAKLSADGRTIVLELPSIQPVMQMNIRARLQTLAGKRIEVDLYNTVNRLK